MLLHFAWSLPRLLQLRTLPRHHVFLQISTNRTPCLFHQARYSLLLTLSALFPIALVVCCSYVLLAHLTCQGLEVLPHSNRVHRQLLRRKRVFSPPAGRFAPTPGPLRDETLSTPARHRSSFKRDAPLCIDGGNALNAQVKLANRYTLKSLRTFLKVFA